MWPLGISQSFDGRDVLARHRPERRIAGGYGTIVDHDVTGAAFARAACEMRPEHAELPKQDVQQRSIGISVDIRLDAIEMKSNVWHRGGPWLAFHYCGLSNFFTTSAPFTISPRRDLSTSSGVIDIGTAPCWVQSLMISGRFSASFTPALILSMTGFGVPAGAIN